MSLLPRSITRPLPPFPFLPFSFRFIMLECPIFPACYAYFSVRSLVFCPRKTVIHAKRRALGLIKLGLGTIHSNLPWAARSMWIRY